MSFEARQVSFEHTLLEVEARGGCDLICMSPPYDNAREYGAGVAWTWEHYATLGDLTKRALKPGGHALVVLDGPIREWRPGYGTERSLRSLEVALDWTRRVGLRAPDRLAYGRMGTPGEYAGRFRNDWEPLLWFQRTGAEGYFNKLEIAGKAKKGAYVGESGVHQEPDGSLRIRRASFQQRERVVAFMVDCAWRIV